MSPVSERSLLAEGSAYEAVEVILNNDCHVTLMLWRASLHLGHWYRTSSIRHAQADLPGRQHVNVARIHSMPDPET